MSQIKLDKAGVATSAAKLTKISSNIRNEFQNVKNKTNTLMQDWDGLASMHAESQFGKICPYIEKVPIKSIDEHARFLLSMINEGYSEIEQENKQLSEQFK